MKKLLHIAMNREVLAYLFFGVLTTVVSLVSYAVPVALGMDALAANIISWILAVLFAYVTNSRWVFRSEARGLSEKCREIAGFYGGRLFTLVMEEVILFVCIKLLHQNEYLVKIFAQVLVMVGNYVISKLFVFRTKKEKNKLTK